MEELWRKLKRLKKKKGGQRAKDVNRRQQMKDWIVSQHDLYCFHESNIYKMYSSSPKDAPYSRGCNTNLSREFLRLPIHSNGSSFLADSVSMLWVLRFMLSQFTKTFIKYLVYLSRRPVCSFSFGDSLCLWSAWAHGLA